MHDELLRRLNETKTMSIVGMCKNAGKTTMLNWMLSGGHLHGTLGLTSIGRDGESTDIVTGTEKPGIFVKEGTLIATAKDMLRLGDVTKEILMTTGIPTPLGEVVILRARSAGHVQLAGPSITTQLKSVSQAFFELGADRSIIDGALGRKSLGARSVAEGVILCTGASYHMSMEKVIADTVHIYRLMNLPKAAELPPEASDGLEACVKEHGAALAPMVDDLLADAETSGRLDFIIQKALFAVRYGGIRPELTETELELTDMINPEICDLLSEQGRSFVPVSIRLEQGATVITGANMGGKSVAMKTVALNALLLQAGFLVCAKKARMPLFHSVKMLFDDLQSIQSGLSGFGSEIVQFQKALTEVEKGYSLFLLDEFARGTNPDEGAVIVQAVTRYLNGVNAISLLTTHYDKVAEYARLHYQIIGLRDVDTEKIRRELSVTDEDGVAVIARHMNYGLYRVEGRSDCPRDALNICRMLSLKPEILKMVEESY